MSVNVVAFGWHATIFLGRWLFVVAGLAAVSVALVIFKIVYGGGRF
jgi:hypothetical protein